MTKTTELFDRLSKSSSMETRILCEEAQTLYISALKGHLSSGEIKEYIKENRLLDRISEQDRSDYSKLLDMIAMIGAAQ